MRRTPLKRGSSSLKQNKPLNKRSQKMSDKYVERRSLVESMLKQYPKCDACIIYTVFDSYQKYDNPSFGVIRRNNTVDIHELVNRSQGGSILDITNLIAVCRSCHSRITVNPKEAELLGLHLESWCNTEENYSEAKRVRDCWRNGIPTKPEWINNE